MSESNICDIAMLFVPTLTKHFVASFEDLMLYHHTMGALQYVMIIQPDIQFTINKLCQFMHNPYIDH